MIDIGRQQWIREQVASGRTTKEVLKEVNRMRQRSTGITMIQMIEEVEDMIECGWARDLNDEPVKIQGTFTDSHTILRVDEVFTITFTCGSPDITSWRITNGPSETAL